MYSSRKPVVKSDDDSDLESRYRSTFSKDNTRSSYNYPTSARGALRELRDPRESRDSRDIRDRDIRDRDSRDRDNDRYETSTSNRYNNYRPSTANRFKSDSEDEKPTSRYGANSRRTVRKSSSSEDSDDKNDKFRRSLSSKTASSRPSTSVRRKDDDFDSYESANQKLKEMIQYDKSLCEQLDDLYDTKVAKEKKIDQLKEEIHRDTIKEDNLRKKLNELRMNKKLLQAKLDEYK